jgi:hypothetical protein
MSLRLETEERGFHTLSFRIAGGRTDVTTVEVMVSRDAQRKLVGQFRAQRVRPMPDRTLITEWGIWIVNDRLDRSGSVPATLAVVASDIDEYGAYTQNLLKAMGIAI